jgi:hypothetical protein
MTRHFTIYSRSLKCYVGAVDCTEERLRHWLGPWVIISPSGLVVVTGRVNQRRG